MGFFSKIVAKKSNHVPANPPGAAKEKSEAELKIPKQSANTKVKIVEQTPNKTPKRLSTIIDGEQLSSLSLEDYHSSNSRSSDSELESGLGSDYEHKHALFDTNKSTSALQFSTLMCLCGLGTLKETFTKLADEELKMTFSLISSDIKIQPLSPTMRNAELHESVIGEYQLNQIKVLKKRISQVLAEPGSPFKESKTLYERYGRVTDIIGRGSYGVIKVIESSPTAGNPRPLYAVKELCKKNNTETHDQFIDRAILEFIISSTLNNKNIVRTIDLMVATEGSVRLCQVMDCFTSGNLFSYCSKVTPSKKYIAIEEVDCMVKQITKGLWYMHSHGVAHCDLKLENILIESDHDGHMVLKLSDFGKSNVFRTKWDTHEQFSPAVPIGSGPYMTPEEHQTLKHISLAKKDCWALGIISLILFNIRRSFFHESNLCMLEYYDYSAQEKDTKCYSNGYLWHSTEPKSSSRIERFKDSVFEEYMKSAMISSYSPKTKEWVVKRQGKFLPIETLFDVPKGFADHGNDTWKDDLDDFEEGDFQIRKFCIYKLLDPDFSTRMTPEELLKSDWLEDVELCCV